MTSKVFQKDNLNCRLMGHYNNFVGLLFKQKKKVTTLFSKPTHLKFSVLEENELLMYEFYYHTPEPYWSEHM